MTVIGVTGPSGAGKGVVSAVLASHGAFVIDCDMVYKAVVTPPSECLDELSAYFGKEILSADGTLDRGVLSELVFGDENKDELLTLNEITHKYVVMKTREKIIELSASDTKLCIIDAPLLIEAGLCEYCKLTISVLADRTVRARRISERDRISIDRAMLRIDSQKNDEFYIDNTNMVIYNDGDVEALTNKIEDLISKEDLLG